MWFPFLADTNNTNKNAAASQNIFAELWHYHVHLISISTSLSYLMIISISRRR